MLKKEFTMNRKDFYIWGLVLSIMIMADMDITPLEAAHLLTHTLPNYIKYQINFI
tara:strand:+ start:10460 stop:10624 length:165 start_codon:yes stop_codon:yes gene_type:complete